MNVHEPAATVGITAYGCGPLEAELFRSSAPRFGVLPTLIAAPLSADTAELAAGNRCVSVGHKHRIENRALDALREVGVGYLTTRSIGRNHIDLDHAARIGLRVGNVSYSPDSVADHTLMLILMALRHARSFVRAVDAQDFRSPELPGRELRDLTVGVVGTGRIGTAVMDRLRGFGCRVLACDRRPGTIAHRVQLDELLESSDVVTLHTPLDADTHHLLDRRRIARMRRGAVVVNTGRGPLIDTEALLAALEDGRLGGAALDVLEGEDGVFYTDRRESPVENKTLVRLHQLPQVLISPHIAYHTDHALQDIVDNTLVNCLAFEKENAA